MMIDDVMYGMIPSANTANCVSAPPENRLQEAEHAAGLRLIAKGLDRLQVDTGHGDVRAEPIDRDHEQGEQDLVPQIRHLEHVPEARQQPKAPFGTRLSVRPTDLGEVSGW